MFEDDQYINFKSEVTSYLRHTVNE